MKTIDIAGRITQTGFAIIHEGREYHVRYPRSVWDAVPARLKAVIRDNVTVAATMHIPMADPEIEAVRYTSARPLLEPYFFQNFIRDIPSCCEINGRDPAEEVRRFLNIEYRFGPGLIAGAGQVAGRTGHAAGIGDAAGAGKDPPSRPGAPTAAIVPMSFGKDSLLTFAVAEELGLRPHMVYVVEPSFENERRHKENLGRQFASEFGHELHVLEHEIGALRDHRVLGADPSEYGWGLQNTEYALLMLPFAIAFDAGYILFGNEQTAGMRDPASIPGWTVYPCYDQTHEWTRHLNEVTLRLSGIRTGSLIEPLMDMMVQRILAHRYPHYARYQMSCFVQGAQGVAARWCHDCEVCAKMFLLCVGSGIDPGTVGFTRSMLAAQGSRHFSLFGGETELPYLRTDLARDEQLFAFHCARLLGSTDDLVAEFARSERAGEAVRREDELKRRFLALYPSVSVPEALKSGLLSIFGEEIAAFIHYLDRQRSDRSTS